jgi:hypothetical protein
MILFGVVYTKIPLGGVVFSVLAIKPKVHRFKPGRRQWIFKGDKNP